MLVVVVVILRAVEVRKDHSFLVVAQCDALSNVVRVVVVQHSRLTIVVSGILVLVDHALTVGIVVVRDYIFQVSVNFGIVIG